LGHCHLFTLKQTIKNKNHFKIHSHPAKPPKTYSCSTQTALTYTSNPSKEVSPNLTPNQTYRVGVFETKTKSLHKEYHFLWLTAQLRIE